MDPISFITVSLALLATPGPTNTLLATAAAETGWRRSIPLLGAELAGYLVAIAGLRIGLGPAIASQPMLLSVLQGLSAAYLVRIALALWLRGGAGSAGGAAIGFKRVLLTTSLNPKAVIFAFAILPPGGATPELAARLALLSGLILSAGLAWLLFGGALHRSFQNPQRARIGYRASAGALALLAGLLATRAFAGF
ncbi:hypothetical protein ASG72_11780 [Bosea sp. Leaf344]|uniref:LysE family translocator n=1 Tax=Bosea sp. Leaf344 TaxID=1736346 RepID=UPI0006F3A8D2|nr:LysE family transporter [Bosea sp. Leaf344]KQU50559.1 hypothetical protein ASG72_11780 [Bosea sp. Leaf344]